MSSSFCVSDATELENCKTFTINMWFFILKTYLNLDMSSNAGDCLTTILTVWLYKKQGVEIDQAFHQD